MMPIPARPGATLKNVGHSDAIMLWKNRQMPNLNARKKNAIPKPAGEYGRRFITSTFSQPFKEKRLSEGVRIGIIIIFDLSKL